MRPSIRCLLTLLALAPAANAGTLDDALLGAGPGLLVDLRGADVKTVGVLPFLVRGGRDAAPLSTGLATRIENTLVLRQDAPKRKPIVVVRVSPAQAGKWDAKKADFDRLFTAKHPAAWGDEPAKADAFLTGEVTLSDDRETAEVAVQLLTADSWDGGPKPQKVLWKEKAKVDPSLRRELGYPTVTSRAMVKSKRPKADASDLTPDDITGMKLEVHYDGKKQTIAPLPGGAFGVPAPKPGQEVVFYLQRVGKGPDTLGVVLKLNGKSLLLGQDAESIACRKWLFAPSKVNREDYRGFYSEQGKSLVCDPFEVKEKADDAPLAARAGWIDVDVFASRPDDRAASDGELLISTRGVPKKKPATLAEAREALAGVNGLALPPVPTKRGPTTDKDIEVKGSGKPVVVGDLRKGKFPNPVRVGGLSIRLVPESSKETD